MGPRYSRHRLSYRCCLPLRGSTPCRGNKFRGEQDPTSIRIRTVRELEALGAEVLVCAADVADRAQMSAVVTSAVDRFGVIDGVIYAAGIAGAGTIQGRRREEDAQVLAPIAAIQPGDADAQFRPKMRGLFVLEEVLGDRPLDFCLIVSSLASILGGPGYAVYAAANLFMDAFVRRHNQRHPVRWLAANWDAWSFSAGSTAVSQVTLTPAEGVEVFDRLLAGPGLGQVVISTLDVYARAAASSGPENTAAEKNDEAQATDDRTRYERPASLASTFEIPQTDVERTVADVWQEVLGIDRVGRRDNFFELGGHSLLAVQVAARLEDALQLEVPMRNVFDAASVADLAARIQIALVARSGHEALVGAAADFEEFEV